MIYEAARKQFQINPWAKFLAMLAISNFSWGPSMNDSFMTADKEGSRHKNAADYMMLMF